MPPAFLDRHTITVESSDHDPLIIQKRVHMLEKKCDFRKLMFTADQKIQEKTRLEGTQI